MRLVIANTDNYSGSTNTDFLWRVPVRAATNSRCRRSNAIGVGGAIDPDPHTVPENPVANTVVKVVIAIVVAFREASITSVVPLDESTTITVLCESTPITSL